MSLTILFSFGKTGWAAVIFCSLTVQECNGTAQDDTIYGAEPITSIIHGLGGNDYIFSRATNTTNADIAHGDDGDDTLIGSPFNDFLLGGNGNDKYDAYFGNDSISEKVASQGLLLSSNDVISSGPGNDDIIAGLGSDVINSGPGIDSVRPNGFWRDFSIDKVDCGSDMDRVDDINSAEDTAVNCETVGDNDG